MYAKVEDARVNRKLNARSTGGIWHPLTCSSAEAGVVSTGSAIGRLICGSSVARFLRLVGFWMKYFRASPKPLPHNEREGRPFRTPLWEGVPQVSAGGVEPFDELGVGRHDLRAAQLHGGREQAVVDGPGLARDGDGAWDAVLREGATGMTGSSGSRSRSAQKAGQSLGLTTTRQVT